jgi:peptide/nickel transport system substrate-binding protein
MKIAPFTLSRRDFSKLLGTHLIALPFAVAGPGFTQAQGQKVLRIIHSYFESWNPIRGVGDYLRWNSLWWASAMYFDAKGNIQPYVFASWVPSHDYKVWTFEVDPNAVFSDGSPITAADVKGSFEVAAMPSTKNPRVNTMLGPVEGFSEVASGRTSEMPGLVVKDTRTLEIKLSGADPVFFMRIATALLPILKASKVRDKSGDEIFEWWSPDNDVVVSGPYKPTELNVDAGRLILETNTLFFGPKPKLNRIEIQVVEDTVTATALLQSGEYQAHSVLLTPTLAQDLGADFASGAIIPRGQHFWLNTSRAPTNDPKVRQALIMAVDRAGLVRASYPQGPHVQAEQILNAVPGVDPTYQSYPFDPEAARRALAESSYGGPDRLPRIMMVGMSQPAFQAAGQYLAEQWRQHLGISAVDMKPQTDSYAGPDQASVQIFRDDVSTRVPDPVVYLTGAIHSSSGNAQGKLGGYKNGTVDALLEKASFLAMDDPERIRMAQEAQRAFRNDWAYIPWVYEALPRWANANVKGIDKNLDWQVAAPWDLTIVS